MKIPTDALGTSLENHWDSTPVRPQRLESNHTSNCSEFESGDSSLMKIVLFCPMTVNCPDPSGESGTRMSNPYELNISPCKEGSNYIAPERLESLQPNLQFD